MRYGANAEFEYQEKPKVVSVEATISAAATVEVKTEPEVVEAPPVVVVPETTPETPETPVIENQGVKENWRTRRQKKDKTALPYGIKETEEVKE
jgi:hypothetical protein